MDMEKRIDGYLAQRSGFKPGAMPKLSPKQLRRVSKKDVCPKCPARGTTPCQTESGNPAKQPHVGRY